jgi:integrase
MGYSQFNTPVQARAAWNAGKTVGTKRPLTQKRIWATRFFLDREGRLRDRALFDLAIDSKLRGCDLVRIAIGEVVAGADIRTRAVVVQKKTGRPVQFELTADVRASLMAWLERRGGTVADYVFPSRVDHTTHMSTRQYARLLDEWVTAIGLRPAEYGTHSLRRTKAAMIYRATGNSYRQHPRDPDPARAYQDREYGALPWGRHRGCTPPGGADRDLTFGRSFGAFGRPLSTRTGRLAADWGWDLALICIEVAG